jgi:DNA-binding transcriptional regulator YhcF (GntR family)
LIKDGVKTNIIIDPSFKSEIQIYGQLTNQFNHLIVQNNQLHENLMALLRSQGRMLTNEKETYVILNNSL